MSNTSTPIVKIKYCPNCGEALRLGNQHNHKVIATNGKETFEYFVCKTQKTLAHVD